MWKEILFILVLCLGVYSETTTYPVSPTESSTTHDLTSTTHDSTSTTRDLTSTKESPTVTSTTNSSPKTTITPSSEPITTTESLPPSTTDSPSTSVVPPITSTIQPVPEVGNWTVEDDNATCIIIKMAALFDIPNLGAFALSPNATSNTSSCHSFNDTEELVLVQSTDISAVFKMVFAKEGQKFYVQDIALKFNLDGSEVHVNNASKFFETSIGNSYLCQVETNIMLENITLHLSHFQVQAFGKNTNSDFGTAEECESDNTVSDVVPIAVGCALAALIVVVLIAYLVGRRRSRQKGYQSV